MSGLAAVLAKRKAPGIYRWHGAFGISEVQHTVEHAGWRFAHVDGWHGDTKDELVEAVHERMGHTAYPPGWCHPPEHRHARLRVLTGWNDARGRTREDVVALLDHAIGRTIVGACRTG